MFDDPYLHVIRPLLENVHPVKDFALADEPTDRIPIPIEREATATAMNFFMASNIFRGASGLKIHETLTTRGNHHHELSDEILTEGWVNVARQSDLKLIQNDIKWLK